MAIKGYERKGKRKKGSDIQEKKNQEAKIEKNEKSDRAEGHSRKTYQTSEFLQPISRQACCYKIASDFSVSKLFLHETEVMDR